MSYAITSFDSLTLPTYTPIHYVGTDGSRIELAPAVGGNYYDSDGSDRARAELKPITVKCMLRAASASALQTAYDAIKAKRGKYGTLTATMGDASTRTRPARMEVSDDYRNARHVLYLPINLTFYPVSFGWKGTAHATPVTLTTSPQYPVLANGGNRRVTDAIITVTAGSANITDLYIEIDNVSPGNQSMRFTGTITAGQSLVIDCGARTVLNNGADAFANFTETASHQVDDWLRLEPGNNTVKVTKTGGSTDSTITVSFSDGWE